MKSTTGRSNFDRFTIITSLIIISAISMFFLTSSELAIDVAGKIFTLIAYNFGTPILWFAFGLLILAGFFTLSKYGHIRMGNEKPEFSTFSYIAMMAMAGFGSGTIYWSFLEWSYYIKTPPFMIEAGSVTAFEWAVTYSLHHWGIIGWAIYCITAIPVMYSFYIRKHHSLRMGDVAKSMIKNPMAANLVGRVVDITYPIAQIFGLLITIALGVPIISAAVSMLLGIENTLFMKGLTLFIITATLLTSSFLGIDKGMQKISNYGAYFVIALVFYILLFGPTQFIIENTSSSIAIWAQNFIMMSLYTDAINQAKFPQSWTAYFWAYWMIFIPLMCVFVTKVSRGRTIREVIVCMIGGGTAGVVTLFSIVGSFMMKTEVDGKVAISEMVSEGQASEAIIAALGTLPLPLLTLVVFIIATFLMLVTSLDGAAFTISCNTQNNLDENNNPSTRLKMFWCLIIVALPAIFIFVDVPVQSMQSAVLIFALPLLLLVTFMLYKTVRYMRDDYSHLSAMDIQAMHQLNVAVDISNQYPGVAEGMLTKETQQTV